MKTIPVPEGCAGSYLRVRLMSVLTDILFGKVNAGTILIAREIDTMIDVEDLPFIHVLVGAIEPYNLEELNKIALEELAKYITEDYKDVCSLTFIVIPF